MIELPDGYRGPALGECHLWWGSISVLTEADLDLLDEVEVSRAQRYQQVADHDRFALGVVLSRLVVGTSLGVDPVDVQLDRSCPDCGQPHGRPIVRGVEGRTALNLSVSHSGQWVLLAVAAGIEVGVDVEQAIERPDNEQIATRMFTLDEQRALAGYSPWTEGFYRYWTAKESAVKATGQGLRIPLINVSVPPPNHTRGKVHFCDHDFAPALLERLDSPSGYQAAVTTITPQKVPLRNLWAVARQPRV